MDLNRTFAEAASRAAQAGPGPSELDNLAEELDELGFKAKMREQYGMDIDKVKMRLETLEEPIRRMQRDGVEVKPTLVEKRAQLVNWLELLQRGGGAAVQPQQLQQQSGSKAWLSRVRSSTLRLERSMLCADKN